MARVDKNCNAKVARLPGVKGAVRDRAEILARRARGLLAAHRETGQARIVVTKGKIDAFVSLEDPNAAAIEYGREAGVSSSGRPYAAQEGLYIIHRTIGAR
ncbi:DUF5403 family protein [Nocardiopsis sp. TNDT3]|uniref:DUF5403 family protein n=1 Tax=Nocardiopsis sp. TNDT3 TaxID=2249354 RepID=UPI000E3CDE68|nr:DUF5403 family protein [Nocardiopsis sp. TNDT3]